MSAAALKKLKKDQLCHQLTIPSATFDKAKTSTSTEAASILACGMFCQDSPATITSSLKLIGIWDSEVDRPVEHA